MPDMTVNRNHQGLYLCLGLHSTSLSQSTASRWFHQIEKGTTRYRLKMLYPSVKLRSQAMYLSRLEHMVNNCCCAVVLMDSLDTGLVFELGWLMARGKPVILFRSDRAEIDIHRYYQETGGQALDPDLLQNLPNPPLSLAFPKDIAIWKKTVTFNPSDMDDFARKVKSTFEHRIGDVEGEIKRLTVPVNVDNDFRADYWLILGKMIEHNTGGETMTGTYIQELMDHMHELSRDKFITLPSEYFETTAEAFNVLIEKKGGEEPKRLDDFRSLVVKGYKEALEDRDPRSEPYLYSTAKEKLGMAYLTLAEVKDPEINVEQAARHFAQGVSALQPGEFPVNYSRLLMNLAESFVLLAKYRDPDSNLKKAREAYEEVVSVLTREDYPEDYKRAEEGLKQIP